MNLAAINFGALTDDEKIELFTLLQRKQEMQLWLYEPYDKQKEFHAAGLKYRERCLMAGNQLGKTFSGAMEMAMHLTGEYPDWWKGKQFTRPIVAWATGLTNETTRDVVQRLLIGRVGHEGTAAIPATHILERRSAPGGLKDALDTVTVKHRLGKSTLAFKSYARGREKWQGETLDCVWFDEEPPMDVYMEGLTRTNATGGLVYMTFTPLKGMSEVVMRFIKKESDDCHLTNMTIDDVDHYTPEEREKIVSAYLPYEREARARGIPVLGSGRAFPIAEEDITVQPFSIPDHWPMIGGIDFGWDHPTAAAKLAWDRDADCIYVTNVYRMREAIPAVHASALKAWGDEMPWAWPHDGLQHDKGSGETLAGMYRKNGLAMLHERATFEGGGNGVEAGVHEMLERMETGRLKVFSNCVDFFDEFRLYHRKNGELVKERDDILSACRYAMMMRRFAKTKKSDSIQAHNYNTNWVV